MTIPADTLRRWLVPVTLAYLALPTAIFLLGWLRPWLGVPLAGALVFATVRAAEEAAPGAPAQPERAVAVGWLGAALLVVAAACAGGATAVAFDFNGDWSQRFEIFRDVARQPWPVTYATEAGPLAQVYYLGWYLPGAVAAKAAGWGAAMGTLLAWSVLGFGLVALWLVVLVRLNPLLAVGVFLLFAGADVWQNLLEDGVRNTLEEVLDGDSFAWQDWFWYQPVHAGFYRSPNHSLCAWLAGALVLDAARRRAVAFPAVWLLAVSLLWSPFVALGLAPLVAALVLAGGGSLGERLRALLRPASLAAGLVGAVVLAYYAARWFPYAVPAVYLEGVATSHDGLWLTRGDVPAGPFLRAWAIFCAVTFGGLAVPLLAVERPWRRLTPRGAVLVAAVVFLLGLPFFRYGWYNDLVHRASLPAVFVLLVAAIDLLGRVRRHPLAAAALAAFLVLAGLTAVAQIVRTAETVRWLSGRNAVAPEPTQDMFDRQLEYVAKEGGFDRVTQYLGSVDSPFFAWLAREPRPRTIHPPPPPPARGRTGPPAAGVSPRPCPPRNPPRCAS